MPDMALPIAGSPQMTATLLAELRSEEGTSVQLKALHENMQMYLPWTRGTIPAPVGSRSGSPDWEPCSQGFFLLVTPEH